MWSIYKIKSGFNSLDNDELGVDAVTEIWETLKVHFGERLCVGSGIGLDLTSSAAGEFTVDGIRLTIGYDIWSGVFIMAHDVAGDKILNEIAPLLNK